MVERTHFGLDHPSVAEYYHIVMSIRASVERVEPGSFAAVVADEIVATILENIEDHGRCSLVLAGGSTPAAIYRLLARPPRVHDIPWENVHLFWGDERWTSAEDSQSNYRMVNETLLSHRKSPSENVHRINTSLAGPEQAAEEYESVVRKFFGLQDQETPVFDLVLLGVGADGHTASIFPGSEVLDDTASICRAVVQPETGSTRITLTPRVLFSGRRILFLVKGRDKAEVVRRIFTGSENDHQLPALLSEKAAERVTWFVCSEAARELDGISP